MRALVTGATGFLGRRLVPMLADACTVTAVGRTVTTSPFAPAVELVVADLADPHAAERVLSPWRWDVAVHLAGPLPPTVDDWHHHRRVIEEHVRLALALTAAIPRGWHGRVVHASSMSVYGVPEHVPIGEDHPRNPTFAYGLAKVLAEDVLAAAGLGDLWMLRLPGLFSGERRSGGLFHFMRAAREGRPIRITADRPTPWDVLHVDDAAIATARAVRAPLRNPGAINVGYGEPVEIGNIARRIASYASSPVAIERTSDVTHPVFHMSIAKADEALGGWPPASLDARLRALWEAYGVEQ